MAFALTIAGIALIVLTVLSRVRSARWWVRFADFPRTQVAVLLAAVLGALVLSGLVSRGAGPFLACVLLGCLAYQCTRILPYTPLAPRQVRPARPGDPQRRMRILISNVLMENRDSSAFLSMVSETDPDVILAVETDDWWDTRLRALDTVYPHAVRQPQGNFFGMHLFSRLPVTAASVRFLVEPEIPSIRATIRLHSGEEIDFMGLHPRPPEPGQDTEERDAELLIAGRELKGSPRPVIVAGDLNDVAWSNTTRVFQRMSGLLDPRRGRGLYSTFPAAYPLLRWPLDHVFHDPRFTLVALRRLRSIGSDHFPVFVELQLEPAAGAVQAPPPPDRSDIELASERIADGLDKAASADRQVSGSGGR